MELKAKVKVEVSARHIHLCQKDLEKLFGVGAVLHPVKALGQPGDFACEERVDVVTSKGSIMVRVLAPLRNQTQIELAPADARKIGLNPPVRHSGNLIGTPGVTVVGPKGKIELTEGVIIAARHMHLDPATAKMMNVKDKELVAVRVVGKRSIILEDVLVRINDNYSPSMHIDTDEGNACLVENGEMVELMPSGSR